jgi:tight adherence protein B
MSADLLAASAAAAGLMLLWSAPPVIGAGRPPVRRVALGAVILFGLLASGQWIGPLVILGAAGLAGRQLWRRRQEARQAEATAARMVEVCDLLASELASGSPPGAALDEAAAAMAALRPVSDACRLGGDVPVALRELARTPGADGLRLLAGAWAVSHRTGAGLAESTRRVADAVRRDQATRRVVAGELSSARATSKLVACLPVMALLMGSGAGADPWRFLVRTPYGLACLGAGLAIGFLGLWWIELIAREVER